MANITQKVNLAGLKNASIIKSGKNKDVDCLLIPIDQNHLYKSERGAVYLETVGFEISADKRRSDSKDTHLVKQSLSKEILNAMSEEEKKALPILGNMVNWAESGGGATQELTAKSVASENDLPFN